MATITQLPSGKWRVQIRRAHHKPQSKTFTSKSAANAWARNIEAKMELGEISEFGESFSIESLLDKYEREITPRKKTAKTERYMIRHLTRFFGGIDARNLSPQDIVDYVDERMELVVSDTVRKELNVLSRSIDVGAAMWGLRVESNPVAMAKKILTITGTLKSGVQRERRITEEEESILMDSDVADIATFAIETAMRQGEIASALPEHRIGNNLRIPETKTDTPRTIPLTKKAIEIWDAQKLEEGKPVFGMKAASISQLFRRVCQFYQIEDLRFHDLRHEATSRLFEKGLQIQEVALITGHADWKSLRRYTQLKAESLADKI